MIRVRSEQCPLRRRPPLPYKPSDKTRSRLHRREHRKPTENDGHVRAYHVARQRNGRRNKSAALEDAGIGSSLEPRRNGQTRAQAITGLSQLSSVSPKPKQKPKPNQKAKRSLDRVLPARRATTIVIRGWQLKPLSRLRRSKRQTARVGSPPRQESTTGVDATELAETHRDSSCTFNAARPGVGCEHCRRDRAKYGVQAWNFMTRTERLRAVHPPLQRLHNSTNGNLGTITHSDFRASDSASFGLDGCS